MTSGLVAPVISADVLNAFMAVRLQSTEINIVVDSMLDNIIEVKASLQIRCSLACNLFKSCHRQFLQTHLINN